MTFFALLGVLRGFPAAAYGRTPHHKPLCGLDQDKNFSFPNWTFNYCPLHFVDGHYLSLVIDICH